MGSSCGEPSRRSRAVSRSAVVTGGAGAIGRAVMRRLEAAGDRVLALDLEPGDGVVVCDVADEEQVAEAFAEVRRRHGPVEVLVHAAGITGAGTVEQEEPHRWRRIL